MEFIKLLDHTHHKDSLDSREEKTKNLKFKLFVESKYKKQIFPNPNFSLVRRFSVLEILIMQNLALKTTLSQYFPLCNKLLRYYKNVFHFNLKFVQHKTGFSRVSRFGVENLNLQALQDFC